MCILTCHVSIVCTVSNVSREGKNNKKEKKNKCDDFLQKLNSTTCQPDSQGQAKMRTFGCTVTEF